MATMPSGREIHSLKRLEPPTLDSGALESMRGPPDRADDYGDEDEPRSSYESQDPVGAFPGTKEDYTGSSTSNYY